MEYEFLRSNQAETFIKIRGREKKFQLLQTFPFTSDRKRMSIIVRDPRDNRIKMFTKGVILSSRRPTRSSRPDSAPTKNSTSTMSSTSSPPSA